MVADDELVSRCRVVKTPSDNLLVMSAADGSVLMDGPPKSQSNTAGREGAGDCTVNKHTQALHALNSNLCTVL